MRADRLLLLADLLRRRGRMSATELASRLEVTPRTIARDIEALSAMGVPVYAERGRRGGYELLPGYRPEAEELSAEESTALLLGGAGVADALGMDEAFARAARRIASGLPDDHAQRAGHLMDRIVIDPGGWGGAVRHPDALGTAFDAVQRDLRLRIDYRALSSGHGGRRTVDPWGLVLAGGTWYLVAAHRGTPHTYRVSRIRTARVLAETAKRPADLDLRALWKELRAGWNARATTDIVLRIERQHVELALRSLRITSVGTPEVEHESDDRSLIRARVGEVRGVVGVLLGFGSWVEALEPPELRAEMVRIAREALAVYDA
ncbi:WYL domain-containing protein [Epidermidibacterium keratini]|uniref:WYL domain-containing protein n=1 Tax=Epidermidibacterium keratini TaxID=1891644 RepID=A0A7L4YLN9_9ACTN|nr:WYL domain-containing protein [Epidermidibacterium keratini]QHC00106.1 WYL domain-containing protein [Epidermidibacterium keratini]